MTARRALVTGGGGAIGRAVCRALARDGAHVIVHGSGRNRQPEQVVSEIAGAGGTIGFQVEEVLLHKLKASPLKEHIELYAGLVDDETLRKKAEIDQPLPVLHP